MGNQEEKNYNCNDRQGQLGKGTQGDKHRGILVSIKAIVGSGISSQQSGTSQSKDSSLHKQQIYLQMKMNKTLLKYEIANGNGLLRPFVAIM